MKFRLISANKTQPVGKTNWHGRVELSAEINDLDVWEKVVKKLDGLKLSSVANLAEAMVEVSRKKIIEAEAELERARRQKDAEIEELRQRLSFAEADKHRLEQRLVFTERDLKAYKEANAQWAVAAAAAGIDAVIPKEPEGG